ncbi:MAG: hypothetical protein HYS81_04960 [Candidatus Aenigmatarchaeota archaeon]|nr:MAG: hypothetical protein HYS81_04960 [Candidatus Aenigmarchaeota archaeon]
MFQGVVEALTGARKVVDHRIEFGEAVDIVRKIDAKALGSGVDVSYNGWWKNWKQKGCSPEDTVVFLTGGQYFGDGHNQYRNANHVVHESVGSTFYDIKKHKLDVWGGYKTQRVGDEFDYRWSEGATIKWAESAPAKHDAAVVEGLVN